jgi:hypothetical protein
MRPKLSPDPGLMLPRVEAESGWTGLSAAGTVVTGRRQRFMPHAIPNHSERRIRSACRGVVSLSLAGPGSDYVRRDDTAGAWVLAGVVTPGTAPWCYPAGPEEAHVLGYPRGRTAADFSTTSWQTSR